MQSAPKAFFCAIAIVVIGTTAGLFAADSNGGNGATTQALSLPSFGVTIVPPHGWTRVRERAEGTAGKWVLVDLKSKTAQVIQLDVRPSDSVPNFEKFVAGLSAEANAQITDAKVKLGDVDAVEMVADAPKKPMPIQLIVARVAEHNGLIYVLYFFAPPKTADRSAFDAVASGIEFQKLISPNQCIASRGEEAAAMPLLDLPMTLDIPDPYRLSHEDRARDHYVTYDFAGKALGATIDLTRGTARGRSFGDIKAAVAQAAIGEGFEETPKWKPLPGSANIVYCDRIARKAKADGTALGSAQILIVMNAPDAYAKILFCYPAGEDIAGYTSSFDKIARSIHKIEPEK